MQAEILENSTIVRYSMCYHFQQMETQTSPRIPKRVAKSEQIATALTEADVALFQRAATVAGRPLTEWMREVALAASVAPEWALAPGEGVRRHAVIVRASEVQKAAIVKSAAAAKVKLSSFMRAVALAEARRLGIK